jgi:hypothetical protein
MARTTWKQVEREAAKCVGGQRFPANMGGPEDIGLWDGTQVIRHPRFACQVKNVGSLSLSSLVALLRTLEGAREQKRIPVVFVKWSGGRGRAAPLLAVLPAWALRELIGPPNTGV